MMKFSEFYFYEMVISVNDEVYYKGKPYIVKSIDGDNIELIDTNRTRGTFIVSINDIQALQIGMSDEISGQRSAVHKKRKIRKDDGQRRDTIDAVQLSLL